MAVVRYQRRLLVAIGQYPSSCLEVDIVSCQSLRLPMYSAVSGYTTVCVYIVHWYNYVQYMHAYGVLVYVCMGIWVCVCLYVCVRACVSVCVCPYVCVWCVCRSSFVAILSWIVY